MNAQIQEVIEILERDAYTNRIGEALEKLRALRLPQHSGDTVPVPKQALEWLFGEGPDGDGRHFGEIEDEVKPLAGKYPRRYWWRSKLRSMIPALSDTRPLHNTQGD